MSHNNHPLVKRLEGCFFKQNNWVSFYDYAQLNSGVEYRAGEFVVFDASSTGACSHADLAASHSSNKLVGLSLTKVIRGFIQEGDLPTYVLLEDVFGRTELASCGIRCDTTCFDQFLPSCHVSTISIASFVVAYAKCSISNISNTFYVDVDRKEVHAGACSSVGRVQPTLLSNHNISFYHAVYKRCTAHVIGEISPDDGAEGALLLLRYFYRHDEDEIVVADAAEKLVQTALKGRTYFKKVPRLWSNHFAVARVKNPRLEDAIFFCEPAEFTHLEVCCFLRYEIPSKRILALPTYLKDLPATVPEIDPSLLAPAIEEVIPKRKVKFIPTMNQSEQQPADKRRKRSLREDSSGSSDSTSPRESDSFSSVGGPSPKRPKVRSSISEEFSDDGSTSSSTVFNDASYPSSPLPSHRNSVDLGSGVFYPNQPPMMMMQQLPANPFLQAYFPSPYANFAMFGAVPAPSHLWAAPNATMPNTLPPIRSSLTASPMRMQHMLPTMPPTLQLSTQPHLPTHFSTPNITSSSMGLESLLEAISADAPHQSRASSAATSPKMAIPHPQMQRA